MNREMQIIREVNVQAENFYTDAVKLGTHAASVLGPSEKSTHRSQITGLENIAESAFKTSDVFDYIKKQIARFPSWRQPFPEQQGAPIGFGERLKHYLEDDLRQRRDTLCDRLGIGDATDEDRQTRRRIHLLLMRQFLRQMAAEYEYQVSSGTNKKEP
jgi:hypothetical protein